MKAYLSLLLCAATICLAQTPPASLIFDKDAVHEIRLTFSQSDFWEQLTKNYTENENDVPYIEAALKWGDYQFDIVGVRFKGNSSYNGATTKKKPFRIKLNEFVKGQKIGGMASFSLSNAWNDPSFVREKPYYELAAGAGLNAPRSGFAALYINDQYWGLYVLTEVVNGDFLKSFFGKGNDGGNLYKADSIGTSFEYLGTDPAAYKNTWEKQSNEDADDWTDLIQLCKTLNDATAADLEPRLEPLMDIDSVLTALALDNLTVNLDSYVSMGQNFYIYRRPTDNKFVWIPWDPSLAFGALSQGLSIQQMKELALEYVQATGIQGGAQPGGGAPGVQAGRPLATKLWQVPKYKQRYREIYQRLVDKVLIPDTVVARMNGLREMIRPWVQKDTQKLVTQDQFDQAMTTDTSGSGIGGGNIPGGGGPGGVPAGAGASGGIPGLTPFINGRVLAAKALLAGRTPLNVTATPASLTFLRTLTGSATPQTVQLALSDAAANGTFSALPSAPWITVDKISGSLPSALTVGAAGANLAVGSYSGVVTLSVAGTTNSPLAISVSLIITAAPALVVSPASLTFGNFNPLPGGGQPGAPGPPGAPGTGQANTSQIVQVLATSAVNFAAAISASTCGNFLAVSPASGVTPTTLTATVNTTGVTAASCTATLTISSSGMDSVKVPVTWSSGQGGGPLGAVPTITALVNGASYASGSIAPGEIVTLFGTGLGPPIVTNGTVTGGRWPTTVAGVQVKFDDIAAPVLYVKDTQIGVVVPFELGGKTQTAVQVSVNGRTSSVLQQTVSPVAPGIFTADGSGTGAASAVNQDGKLNSTTPAAKGSTVSVVITGAGWMEGATSGAVSPLASPLKTAAVVAATVDGQPAAVTFAGSAPGSVLGVYRVQLTLPSTVGSGKARLVIAAAGVPAQSGVTLNVQ